VEPDRRFVDCPYCQASSILDLGGAATCFGLKATHDDEAARGRLAAWLRVHEVRADVEVVGAGGLLVPYWVLGSRSTGLALLAAERADLPLPRHGRAPAGQLEHVDLESTSGEVERLEPTMPLAAARAHLAAREGGDTEATVSLVLVPFTRLEYTHRGISFEAFVDLASGEIHAGEWPRVRRGRFERRLGVLLGAALASYTAIALVVPGAIWTTAAYGVLSAGLYWAFRRLVLAEPSADEGGP